MKERDRGGVGPRYRAFNGRHGGRPLLLEESGRDCYVYYSFNKLLGHPTAQRDESPDQTIDAVQVLRLDLRV